jgi:hypothetical protein
VVAAATFGAAGIAAYEVDGRAQATAFFFYAVCFGVGLLFTLFSALGAHAFGGHGDIGHDVHVGDAHGHAQGHAEGGGGANDMPGFSPLSPTTISAFVTAFGGFGIIFNHMPATSSPWLSAPLAVLGGLAVGATLFWTLNTIFRKTQASSEGRVAELVGQIATVITPIGEESVGEIAYVQAGTRYSAPARSSGGQRFANGANVRIARVVGAQFFVTEA